MQNCRAFQYKVFGDYGVSNRAYGSFQSFAEKTKGKEGKKERGRGGKKETKEVRIEI